MERSASKGYRRRFYYRHGRVGCTLSRRGTGYDARLAPCFYAVGMPDAARFLHTLAMLSGEMIGMDVRVTGIRRKQDGDGENLFILDGDERGKTA